MRCSSGAVTVMPASRSHFGKLVTTLFLRLRPLLQVERNSDARRTPEPSASPSPVIGAGGPGRWRERQPAR
jgi:hypothetical protein